MNIRKVSVFAVLATASLFPTAAFAATATTVPAKAPVAVAPTPTKAARAAAVATVAPAAKKTAKPSKAVAKPTAIVVAGNFCKKVLVGQSSHDKSGGVLNCVADAKGQLRWTK